MNGPIGQPAEEKIQLQSRDDLLRLLVDRQIVLATNVYNGSIGHMALEMDFLARARRYGIIPERKPCLLVLIEDPFALAFAHYYSDLLTPYCISWNVWNWSREIAAVLPELAFNIGVSHLSVERPTTGTGHRPMIWCDRVQFLLSQQAFRERTRRNYGVRAATSDWNPFHRELAPTPELAHFLDLLGNRPLALVHVKQQTINASAGHTDVASYLPTLAQIRDLGWQPVLVGREKLPEEFRRFGVADYPGSGIASQINDLALISKAHVGITGASGIAHAFEMMDLPLVYTDSWHIDFQCSARRCVCVPSTMRERASGRPLTVLEHIAVHKSMPDGNFYTFPHKTHLPEPPAAEHILAAFQEVLTLGPPGTEPPPPNALQERFRLLDPTSPFAAGRSRVGAAWAAAFESRFGNAK